ncbi:hypothetical protein KEM60_00651 [Austwickia sp. TVS 96-490-7B]|uniref:FMN-binding protein n=1 Tax=Austwickia sp. TVS 96-490-7B TaxID=2830843 RepID=UPI001C58AECD|nr:FMN-binding protein [Austwickia sp. TVS 96-490-7B]MBW3084463.1 hypothetical protein [Austwickia sp. TVS 96-490-7B]
MNEVSQYESFTPVEDPRPWVRHVVVGMSTLTVVVLGVSYHTSRKVVTPATSQAGPAVVAAPTPRNAMSSSPSAATARSGGGAPPTLPPGALRDGTFTGSVVSTRRGDVQVEMTVARGRITRSHAVVYPQGKSRDRQINDEALPKYDAAVLAAQSAQIDAVSGATVTWSGYTASLQAAIDQARA